MADTVVLIYFSLLFLALCLVITFALKNPVQKEWTEAVRAEALRDARSIILEKGIKSKTLEGMNLALLMNREIKERLK